MRSVVAVLFAALGVGCTPPTPAVTPVAPARVSASFAKTWDAVIDVLSQRTIPIKTMDRSSGFVAAELAAIPFKDLGDYTTDCGGFMAAMATGSEPGVASYNIVVRGDSTAATVRVTLAVRKGATRCTTKGSFETAMQDDIKARAEGK